MPARQDLPSTLRRSSPKAQETWIKTHDSAVGEYGEGQRAHRVAFAALKHSFEKVGDHWEEKGGKGPSDPQAARTIRDKPVPTAGGVDASATKDHLMELARRLDIRGRARMTKDDLVKAINKANVKKTAGARQPAKRQPAKSQPAKARQPSKAAAPKARQSGRASAASAPGRAGARKATARGRAAAPAKSRQQSGGARKAAGATRRARAR